MSVTEKRFIFIAPVWVRLRRRRVGRDSECPRAEEKLEWSDRRNADVDLDSASLARQFRSPVFRARFPWAFVVELPCVPPQAALVPSRLSLANCEKEGMSF